LQEHVSRHPLETVKFQGHRSKIKATGPNFQILCDCETEPSATSCCYCRQLLADTVVVAINNASRHRGYRG